ncbi:MAG: twin transmembrane helix small protein [Pseudomonadota bacterium]|nr:twin transmembrane helix small protein [Pseudomonadota bacterium]
MSHDQIILTVVLLAVAGILGWGVLTMARGGEYNIKNSNRIMRYRIIFQAIALVIILGLMWWQRIPS